MTSRYTRLDRLISQYLEISRKSIRPLLAAGRIRVDGAVSHNGQQRVGPFSRIEFDQYVLQSSDPCYIMMNKPAGVVSATRDSQHATVIDLLRERFESRGEELPGNLHIAGRLDFNSTGLLLITNDGTWSRRLSHPEYQIQKHYRVTVQNPVSPECIQTFATGMYFEYEGITTLPAEITIISDHEAEVSLQEGRYHQIKRMFGRFQNRVVTLHRYAIGDIRLDPALEPGGYRFLKQEEISLV